MRYVKTLMISFALFIFSLTYCQAQDIFVDESELNAISQTSIDWNNMPQESMRGDRYNGDYYSYNADGTAAVIETLIVRPIGFITTVCGTALFVGMSPLTALASIAPPHDAFPKTAKALIISPAEYTFRRPMGDFDFLSK